MTESDPIARRLAAIVETSDDAIVSKDLNGIVLSWNQAAERMFGYTAEQIVGKSIRLIIPAERQSEEDTVLAAIRAGRRVEHFETVRRARDGRLVPISLTVSPVLDANGKVIGASKIARDISDRKNAEQQAAKASQRDAFLAEATVILTSSVDYEETLRSLCRLAVPYLADYSAFDVINLDGVLTRVAAVHALPEKVSLAEDLRTRYADQGAATPHEVIRTKTLAVIRHITDEMMIASAHGDDARLARIREFGANSYVCVPIVSGERALGALTLANTESGRHFSDEDIRVAQDLAARAALAIDTAQSYQQLHNANRLKDEFLATLSHELRTPLNAVLGYAKMLHSGAIAEKKIPQALEVIDRNAAALAQIVEDVLDVSRIVLGKARLKVQATDVAVVVEDAVATVTPAAEAKGIQLKCSLGHGTATVLGIRDDCSRLCGTCFRMPSSSLPVAARSTCRSGRAPPTSRSW